MTRTILRSAVIWCATLWRSHPLTKTVHMPSTKMAKPNSSIITTGIPKSTVRLSRRICLASFFTNDVNCFMSVSSFSCSRQSWLRLPAGIPPESAPSASGAAAEAAKTRLHFCCFLFEFQTISVHYDGTEWLVGTKRDGEMMLTIDDIAQTYDETACDYDANDQSGCEA